MKNILFCMAACLAILSSCKKDHSNYDYTSNEKIKQTGLATSYTVRAQLDTLKITPAVTDNLNSNDFEYVWSFIYNEASPIGYFDTVATTRVLTYPVKKDIGIYKLVLSVKNRSTKYTEYFTSTVNVVTEFTDGWYVAKDNGTEADLDFFATSGSVTPISSQIDIYSRINGHKLPGTANLLSYLASYLAPVNNVVTTKKVLIFTTEKDAEIADISTLESINTANNGIFMSKPATIGPCYAYIGLFYAYMINNGNLYSLYYYSNPKFAIRYLRDAGNSPYQLSKYHLSYFGADGNYYYDETSNSFVGTNLSSGTTLMSLTDNTGTEMSVNNTNKKLLYMGAKSISYSNSEYHTTGTVIFQDKTNPSEKKLANIETERYKMKLTNVKTLTATDKLYNGSNFAQIFYDEDILYFSVNNREVWSRNLSNNSEKLEYTVPAGEEITFIRHKRDIDGGGYGYNYMFVGSKVGSNYKVRLFNKSSGSISGSPAITLEGTGIPRDVILVAPNATEKTSMVSW